MIDCVFPKMLESPEILYKLPSPVKEAKEGGLKALVGLMIICSCLVLGYCSLTIKHKVCCPFGCCNLDTT